ncbi:MAG: MerR family transcriptional regulator [Cypionkella sp.]
MDKSPEAFRTISEVAEFLETPAHVLRFWESRFPQIRPVKRAGGRRYYRPGDVALLSGIKHLLHEEGLTIRGVQKILREQGVRHVAGLSGQAYVDDGEEDAEAALEEALALNFGNEAEPEEDVAPEKAATATVVALETALRRQDSAPPMRWPSALTPADPEAEPAPDAPFTHVEIEETAEITQLPFAAAVETEELKSIEAMGDDADDASVDGTSPELENDDFEGTGFETVELEADGFDTAALEPTLTEVESAAPYPTPTGRESQAGADSLIERLRALPPLALQHSEDAYALHDQLSDLLARMQASPEASAHSL